MAKVKAKVSDSGSSEGTPTAAKVHTESERIIQHTRETLKRSRNNDVKKDDIDIKEKMKAQEILDELERLYSPENFLPLVKSPADLMIMLTGREKIWKISDGEAKAIATNASTTAKYFLQTEPKYVALAMLCMSVCTVYGTRAALHYREVVEEKKKGNNAA